MPRQDTIGTDFTQGRIMPLLLRFVLPYLAASALNSLYNTVDTVIIGQFLGSRGIVAVSMGGKMLSLFTLVGTALAGGGQVLISQEIGAHRRSELNSTIGTLFSELLLLSLVFAGLTLLFSEQIIRVINTPEESVDWALSYLRITSAGLPLIFGYNAVSSVLRGMGDSKSPLLFIGIATAINLVLDIVFIVVFKLGVTGTALATIIGQGSSLVFSLSVLYRRRERFGFDFRLRSFAVCRGKLWIMLKIGVPVALRSVCIIVTQLFMLRFVNDFGLAASAAYNVGDKIYCLANIVAISTREAGGSVVAQNIGALRYDRARETAKCVAIISFSAAALVTVLSLCFPVTIFSFFTSDASVLEHAKAFMYICCIVYILTAVIAPYESILSGTGNAPLSFLAGFLDGVVFRVFFGLLLGLRLGLGAEGIFLGDALARLGIIIVGAAYYHSGAWKRRKRLVDG